MAAAYLAPAVMFVGLAVRGADGAAAAALFAFAMLAVLAARIWTVPESAVVDAVRANLTSLCAAGAFIAYGLITAIIVKVDPATGGAGGPWHPLWAELSPGARAISLAPYRTLEGVAAFLAPCAAFAVAAIEPKDRSGRNRIALAIMAMSGLFAALAIAVYAANPHGRLALFFVSPNSAATAFGVTAMLAAGAIARAARQAPRRQRQKNIPKFVQALTTLSAAPVSTGVFFIAGACLALTGSRAGVLSAGVALTAFAALIAIGRMRGRTGKTRGQLRLVLGLLIAAAIALALAGGHVAMERFTHTEADIADRATLWSTHWKAFLDRPLLGHGLNTFREINSHYTDAETWQALHVSGAAHNIFIQALEESGLIGAVLWAAMLASPIWRAGRRALAGGGGAETAAAALAALILCLVHGLVDFGLQTPAIAALIAFALAYSANSGSANSTTGKGSDEDADSEDWAEAGPANATQRNKPAPD